MEIVPNFENIKDEFPVVAPGMYPARILEIGSDTGWEGEPAVKVTFEIFGDKHVGSRLWWNKLATDGPNARKFQKLLEAALGEAPAGSFETDVLLGREVKVQVVNSTAKDGSKVYANIKTVHPMAE